MASEQDATEFVDESYHSSEQSMETPTADWSQQPAEAAPTYEEVDAAVAEKQQRLAELRRAQEELERERAALEETRRRHMEFKTGRDEMIVHLTRGVGLLEESEITARRDAELAARTLESFKDALKKVQAISQDNWTKDELHVELTRALTTIENARMEWNSARVKLPVLHGEIKTEATAKAAAVSPAMGLANLGFWQLCKLGFALTWPLLVVALAALGVFIAMLGSRH